MVTAQQWNSIKLIQETLEFISTYSGNEEEFEAATANWYYQTQSKRVFEKKLTKVKYCTYSSFSTLMMTELARETQATSK